MKPSEAELIQKLEAIPSIQDRIDKVAEDYQSGENRFELIDDWQLGELLGIDWDSAASWGYSSWAYKQKLSECCGPFPYAENINLLESHLSPSRYQELLAKSKATLKNDGPNDLPLSAKEIELIDEAFAKSKADTSDIGLAYTTLESSSGVDLEFEVCIGCVGEPCEARSPYSLDKGEGFNTDEYVEVH
ncbi:hypothetical protein N8843_07730 [Verrucomicrobia bacterium]|jgi:hypothetical protein|nr:hypothetical protein [Verrucomicrobiota bacterium]